MHIYIYIYIFVCVCVCVCTLALLSAQRNLSSANLQFSVGPLPTNRGVPQKSNTFGWKRIVLISQAFLLKIQYVMKPRKTSEEGTDERIWLIDEDGSKFHDDLSITMNIAFGGTTSKEAHPYSSPPPPSTLSPHAKWSLTRGIATVGYVTAGQVRI